VRFVAPNSISRGSRHDDAEHLEGDLARVGLGRSSPSSIAICTALVSSRSSSVWRSRSRRAWRRVVVVFAAGRVDRAAARQARRCGHVIQFSKSARRPLQPRGAFIAGRNTCSVNWRAASSRAPPAAPLGAEVGEEPALRQPGALRQRADGEGLEPGLARLLARRREDLGAGSSPWCGAVAAAFMRPE
jgi:primosomal replication protein N